MIVLWRTTTTCNDACGFCAYDRRLTRRRGERTLLSWLGGEPLLWHPVWELSAQLQASGLSISATTNGSTLHHPRGRAGGWHEVRDGVHRLADARGAAPLKLRVDVVLMRETIGHFAEPCETLADWGVDEITFNQLGGQDRPAFFSLQRLRASASQRALAVEDCRPGRTFLFIDEHGMVAPCSFPITSLRTVDDLEALPGQFTAARTARRLAACDDCPSTHTFEKFAV